MPAVLPIPTTESPLTVLPRPTEFSRSIALAVERRSLSRMVPICSWWSCLLQKKCYLIKNIIFSSKIITWSSQQKTWWRGTWCRHKKKKKISILRLKKCRSIGWSWNIEYRSDDITKNFFSHFSVLDTMYRWSMMKNIHSQNLVRIGSWWPEIWPHEYLISPTETNVNWPGSKQLWTRPIYTDFYGAN